jgi:hypothetical protein
MRIRKSWWIGLASLLVCEPVVVRAADPPVVLASATEVDPASVLPLAELSPEFQGPVAEVIERHHFHHHGQSETFPCQPKVYLSLLNEPALTLSLWQDLSPSPAKLWEVAPGSFQGTDGNGTTATWQFAYRSPRLHVLFCNLHYEGPRGATVLDGRLVLIVRTNYFKEASGSPWIQHDIEAFVKVDSKGWRAVARTVRPIIERLLEDQIQEAGWFISLMGRLVESYPDWATQVASGQAPLSEEGRSQFRALIAENRRPDASTGRPALAAEPAESLRR